MEEKAKYTEDENISKETGEKLTIQKLRNIYNETKEETKEEKEKSHKFWDTMPVPKINTDNDGSKGPLIIQTKEDIQKEPYQIPPKYEWVEIDIKEEKEIEDV
jgi:glycylpeptide N-tetradecanoyltransferase